jgi:hypothetical protein
MTIVFVLSKLFEMCIYNRIKNQLGLSGMQLGFVSGGGCEKAIYIL